MSPDLVPPAGEGRRAGATIFLSAGEASGDLHGAEVARELRRRRPDLRLLGLGGSRMAAEGVRLLAGLDRLAVMGFTEVLRKLPFFWSLRRRVRRCLAREEVDLVLPIDYPGFNLPLAEHAHGLGIPVLYYIAPQVWAWREKRAARLAASCDRVCVVLPFERDLLARHGVDARFVGHPLLDAGSGPSPPAEPERRLLGLFPGSRAQEVERMLPPFLGAADRLRASWPELRVAVGRASDLSEEVYRRAGLSEDGPPLRAAEEVVGAARAALTKSGTITLQLALAGVPMVVGYRTGGLTYRLARRLVDVEHIALVNLVAGERLVPEFLQQAVAPEALAEATEPLLADGPERGRVLEGLGRVREKLGTPGCAARVAEHVLDLLG